MRKSFLLLLIALLTVTSAEANDACQADFDGNGVVDFADFLRFNTLYGQRGDEQCAKTADADSLAVVTALRDSISALQAALGATRFAVATLQSTTTELQNALASETERANENQRLLTASNEAFNSLAQTRCPESEPAPEPPEPEPPVVIEPAPQPEPPVVIEPPPLPVPRVEVQASRYTGAYGGTVNFNKEIRADGDVWILDLELSGAGLPNRDSYVYVENETYLFPLQIRVKTGVDTWRDVTEDASRLEWGTNFSPPLQLDGPFLQYQFRVTSSWRVQGCLDIELDNNGWFYECFRVVTE